VKVLFLALLSLCAVSVHAQDRYADLQRGHPGAVAECRLDKSAVSSPQPVVQFQCVERLGEGQYDWFYLEIAYDRLPQSWKKSLSSRAYFYLAREGDDLVTIQAGPLTVCDPGYDRGGYNRAGPPAYCNSQWLTQAAEQHGIPPKTAENTLVMKLSEETMDEQLKLQVEVLLRQYPNTPLAHYLSCAIQAYQQPSFTEAVTLRKNWLEDVGADIRRWAHVHARG